MLIPDFKGDWDALQAVMDAKPEILNHNTETVPRLYRTVRPQAKYERSLELLQRAKRMDPLSLTKTGIMVGIGETWDEILRVLDDMRGTRCGHRNHRPVFTAEPVPSPHRSLLRARRV